MNKTEAIARLRENSDALRSMGATSLYVFGSTVANGATEDSDIDLFIDYNPASRFNAFDLIWMQLLLENQLRIPVDLTTRDSLHPRLKASIEQSAIRVF